MSNCMQGHPTDSCDLVTKTKESDSDELDIIEVGEDHAETKSFSKSESEIPAEKQNGFSMDFLENDDDLLIIDLQDVEKALMADNRSTLQSFDEMRNLNKDKKFDEWVYVETNRKTFQIHDNLLLVSSVYDDERNCCVVQ